MDLLPAWLEVFNLLLSFDEETTKIEAAIIFEVFSTANGFIEYAKSSPVVSEILDRPRAVDFGEVG